MGFLLQSGDSFTPAPSKESLLDRLPVGNYTVEESMMGMYFQRTEDFKPAPKLYGKLPAYADRIMRSFADRPGNTGVLLAGEKGSGKSLLARLVSERAAETEGMATVMVNRAFGGDKLGPLLNALTFPAVVFFDEFEKTYSDREVQESVLSLLDGSGSGRHLFVLTINDTYRLDSHLKNRPGRLYYSLEFTGLESSFIREYCEDRLVDQSQLESVLTLTTLFETFNFDMLKALVEEMNRYGESAAEAAKFLNVTPTETLEWYDVRALDPQGVERKLDDTTWYGNPLVLEEFEVELADVEEEENDSSREDDHLASWEKLLLQGTPRDENALAISVADLSSFSASEKTYTFQKEGWTVILTAQARKKGAPHWTQLL